MCSIYRWRKKKRPFIGIVLSINGIDYFAPLFSPKEKHKKLVNKIDFIQLDNGKLGGINLNNMIPVPKNVLTKVDIYITKNDDEDTIKYKKLLQSQLR